jgi:hypothetical protein
LGNFWLIFGGFWRSFDEILADFGGFWRFLVDLFLYDIYYCDSISFDD